MGQEIAFRANQPDRFTFSGHESFPLRFAWLPKAVREIRLNPWLFNTESAPVILGVGKNMAAAIRYWALATGMLASTVNRGELVVTELGQAIFGEDGWDPALEDLATSWLLHWKLVSARERASTWWLTFMRFPTALFTRDSLTDWIFDIADQSPAKRATRSSIKRDVDVFIRTYSPSRLAQSRSPEDSLDSPLVELGLIRDESNGLTGEERYWFGRAKRGSLPNSVLAYAILDYWDRNFQGQQTTSFESLAFLEGSPGSAFKLAEFDLAQRLDRELEDFGLRFDDTAGTRVVYRDLRTPHEILEILRSYYVQQPFRS